jgi:hypothetical protein
MTSNAVSDNISMTSDELRETKKQLKELEQKLDDKVYNVKRVFYKKWIGDKFYQKYIAEYNVYGSRSQGTLIRNAVSGERMPDYVGSKNEFQYFKVISTNIPGAKGPVTLFYNSPAEYELHQYTTVSDSIKDQWRTRKQSQLGLTA